ncbi:MAG: PilZ domain-containing protein [Acidobacteria bacterium]|nr:PilZ domain-containing protein [Acidobacteriota bacterium]
MIDPTYARERRHPRMGVRIPARVRPLSDQEVEELSRRLALEPTWAPRAPGDGAARSTPSTYEQAALTHLVERVDRMERTLELIATKLGIPLGSPAEWVEGEAVDISAGGTGLDLPQRFPQDTPLELELTLLGEPTATVRCIGRVAFAARPDGAARPVGLFRMGVAYESIHPSDREALVRYFFKLQRAQLRERHQEP